MWHLIDLEIRKKKITNKKEFKNILIESWTKVSTDVYKNVIESMSRHLQSIIDNNALCTNIKFVLYLKNVYKYPYKKSRTFTCSDTFFRFKNYFLLNYLYKSDYCGFRLYVYY